MEAQMKAKERKRLKDAEKFRRLLNQVAEQVNKLDKMLTKGVKVIQGGRGYVSVRKMREAAMDQLHELAIRGYGGESLKKAA